MEPCDVLPLFVLCPCRGRHSHSNHWVIRTVLALELFLLCRLRLPAPGHHQYRGALRMAPASFPWWALGARCVIGRSEGQLEQRNVVGQMVNKRRNDNGIRDGFLLALTNKAPLRLPVVLALIHRNEGAIANPECSYNNPPTVVDRRGPTIGRLKCCMAYVRSL